MSGRMLAVDPGLHHCGVAQFINSELSWAMLIEAEATSPNPDRVALWRLMGEYFLDHFAVNYGQLVVETQQVYRRGKGDNNDLVDLSGVVGAIVGVAPIGWSVKSYSPREWKGQTPKSVMMDRIKSWLTIEERSRVELPKAKKLHQDVFDAIGLGIVHLRKTGQRK